MADDDDEMMTRCVCVCLLLLVFEGRTLNFLSHILIIIVMMIFDARSFVVVVPSVVVHEVM